MAELRQSVAHDGHLRRLGKRTTAALFRAAGRTPEKNFALVSVSRDGQLLGYAVATTNVRALYRSAVLTDLLILPLLVFRAALSRNFLRAVLGVVFGGPGDRAPSDDLTLLDIAVTPSQRGLGIGRDLVEAVVCEARRRGHRAVALSMVAGNEAATALYRRAGFSETGRSMLRDGRVSIRMLRRLS